jgi:hypothetical protein
MVHNARLLMLLAMGSGNTFIEATQEEFVLDGLFGPLWLLPTAGGTVNVARKRVLLPRASFPN